MLAFLQLHKTALTLLAFILAVLAVFYYGVKFERSRWEKKQLEAQIEIQKLKEQVANKQTEIVTKFVYKDRIIKQKQDAIVKEVIKYEKIIDRNCDIPNAAIMLLDQAATATTSSESTTDATTENSQ